jgi:adenylate cyclase
MEGILTGDPKVQGEIHIEHERKFVVDKPPENYDTFPCVIQRQGYTEDRPVVRLREERKIVDGREEAPRYFRTIKTAIRDDNGMSREEDERELTQEAFEEAWKGVTSMVLKKRYRIPVGNDNEVELDQLLYREYKEGNQWNKEEFKDIFFAEFEDLDKIAVEAFNPPSWFGMEVTNDKEYSMKKIARKGIPQRQD